MKSFNLLLLATILLFSCKSQTESSEKSEQIIEASKWETIDLVDEFGEKSGNTAKMATLKSLSQKSDGVIRIQDSITIIQLPFEYFDKNSFNKFKMKFGEDIEIYEFFYFKEQLIANKESGLAPRIKESKMPVKIIINDKPYEIPPFS